VLVQLICVLALGAGAATGFGPLCLCEGLLSKCFGMAVGWLLSGYGCGSSTQSYFFTPEVIGIGMHVLVLHCMTAASV
jgi:hypothetical protein